MRHLFAGQSSVAPRQSRRLRAALTWPSPICCTPHPPLGGVLGYFWTRVHGVIRECRLGFVYKINSHLELFIRAAIECEHRWRYLRDRFTRERKRKSQQSLTGLPCKTGNWPLAQQMNFIQDFIKHRRYDEQKTMTIKSQQLIRNQQGACQHHRTGNSGQPPARRRN